MWSVIKPLLFSSVVNLLPSSFPGGYKLQVTHTVMFVCVNLHRFVIVLDLKFRNCFLVVYWTLFNSFCLNSLSAARAVGERGPSPSRRAGVAILQPPPSTGSYCWVVFYWITFSDCLQCSLLKHFCAVPRVVSFNIHIHIFSVLAGVYFTLTWGVFWMLDCYLLMVISSHHKVTVERDEQRGKKLSGIYSKYSLLLETLSEV